MKYRIISGETPTKIADEVNDALLDGWEPQGGVSVQMIWTGESFRGFYFQAVTRDSS